MVGTYKKDDCIIDGVTYTYEVGQDSKTGNCLKINVIGTGTKDNRIAPSKPDAFWCSIPLPENILTIGDIGFIEYIEKELQQYKVS